MGALGRVGRGFDSAAELCWGLGFGRAGLGFGSGGRAGLGWARLL